MKKYIFLVIILLISAISLTQTSLAKISAFDENPTKAVDMRADSLAAEQAIAKSTAAMAEQLKKLTESGSGNSDLGNISKSLERIEDLLKKQNLLLTKMLNRPTR